MSIVIKSSEVNLLIYKYLQEAGLNHTAYTFFNQSKLADTAKQFKFNVKSGHLITLLEKALIFAQIQSHINFSEYIECKQPFYLLKPHTCQITQKVKQDKEKFMKQLNNNVADAIRRTNAIYHTQMNKKTYEEIIYDPRGTIFLQRCPKIKFLNPQNENLNHIYMTGSQKGKIAVYDNEDSCITVFDIDQENKYALETESIFPTMVQQKIASLKMMKMSLDCSYLIEVYPKNVINIREFNDKFETINIHTCQITIFNDYLSEMQAESFLQISKISFNQKCPYLVALSNQYQYCVLNLKNQKIVLNGKGKFCWRIYSQYLMYDLEQVQLSSQQYIFLKNLLPDSDGKTQIMKVKKQNKLENIEQIQVNNNKTYFSVRTSSNSIYIYTFANENPLYIFSNPEDKQSNAPYLLKTFWINSKDVEYFVILTSDQLKVFQVQLNAFPKIIELKDYDLQAKDMTWVAKNDMEKYVICLGAQNILVYDVSLIKIERIQLARELQHKIVQVNEKCISVINNHGIYFLTSKQLEPLFQ